MITDCNHEITEVSCISEEDVDTAVDHILTMHGGSVSKDEVKVNTWVGWESSYYALGLVIVKSTEYVVGRIKFQYPPANLN